VLSENFCFQNEVDAAPVFGDLQLVAAVPQSISVKDEVHKQFSKVYAAGGNIDKLNSTKLNKLGLFHLLILIRIQSQDRERENERLRERES
jgi:hypothetical protein